MTLQPVNSSSLAAVGYDARSKTLFVEFCHGARYRYFEVPKSAYKELMAAKSHGQYFARKIRDKYRYARC